MVTGKALVLVVDDELQLNKALSRVLENDGYRVITAPDGETALGLIKEKSPDVVLLDLLMPGMDGREVCRRVRKISKATKIIYFTAKVELDPLKSRELRSEADAFIAKPATSKKLLSTVSKVLQGAQ